MAGGHFSNYSATQVPNDTYGKWYGKSLFDIIEKYIVTATILN